MIWDLYEGDLLFNLHAGQRQALNCPARFVAVVAGAQSGKTVFGPTWLLREIGRCGAGDYLVVTPSYPLLEKKALPSFLTLFKDTLKLGHYSPGRRVFTLEEEGLARLGIEQAVTVFFGHASDPDSLESATARAAWLDEAGQNRFKLQSWEAIQRRLAIHQGRALFTTTPYNLGWFKQQVCDRAAFDPNYSVVRFTSTQNPAFPREEFERAARTLPEWKFRMFYLGEFTRPGGLVYSAFEPSRHIVPPFEIPSDWPRFLGLDFGGVNTAGVFVALDPHTGRLFAYREYHAGNCTAADHVAALLDGEPVIPTAFGGSPGESQWRMEFTQAGLPVGKPAVSDLQVGIQRVFAAHKTHRLFIFQGLKNYLDEKLRYAWALDTEGRPVQEIEDEETFHLMDAERYIISSLDDTGSGESGVVPPADLLREAGW